MVTVIGLQQIENWCDHVYYIVFQKNQSYQI